jgi:tRNA nucleotidyltransferase (CCA-adding enzyme)
LSELGCEVDFSIPRLDNKVGAGHKEFKVVCDPNLSLAERCKRRDLTMNSMEMDPFTGAIEDPFDGLKDLRHGRMKATDPLTFGDDDLRAVRVAQFVSRFPSMVPDDQLLELCSKADLSNLPGERLWEEFKKMLVKGSRPDLGLEFLERAGLLKFFPEVAALAGCQQHPVFHAEGDVLVHTKMVLKVAASLRSGDAKDDLVLMLSSLCHDLGKPPTTRFDHTKGRYVSNDHDNAGVAPTQSFLKRLMAPKWVVDDVSTLVQVHLRPFELVKQNAGASAYRRLARKMNGVSLDLLVKLATADGEGRICYEGGKQTREDLKLFLTRAAEAGVKNVTEPVADVVKGSHLLERGMKPGPEVGEVLKKCREYYDATGETDPNKILDEVLK